MEQIELRAESRDVFGKKTKRLRRSGLIPATLYGPRTEPVSLQVRERDLRSVLDRAGMHQLISLWIDQADRPRLTLAREVQRDVITHSLLHVDLYEVVMTERITAETPLTLVGEAPAVATKAGLLVRGLDSVQVQCLPGELPESIDVDVSVLEETDQAILVKDLVLDEAIEILTNPEEVIVKVLPLKELEVEEVVEEEVEPVEVEVIAAAKEREEEPEEVLEEAEQPEDEEPEGEAD
ncbi:MAG: 50S ribosomal protein L25 [Anaerolineae bacterium]